MEISQKKVIKNQVINEKAAYGPFDLTPFFESTTPPTFTAELEGGGPLPKGLICTPQGQLTGIPAAGTSGNDQVKIIASNNEKIVEGMMTLTIKPSLATRDQATSMDELKATVWQALENKQPLPDLAELYDREVSPQDVYYLLERWGYLVIWDAFNLEPMGEPMAIQLEGASEHYHVYDRGSGLMAVPKELFSHERTLEDGMRTARALAREVHNRGWTIELAGVSKFTHAAWIEISHLNEKGEKFVEVLNFEATEQAIRIYEAQHQARSQLE